MTTKNKWRLIKSWNVGTPDGSVEKYSLYEHTEEGSIKIENDFGNVSIEMEQMSGYEFLKKAYREVQETLSDSLNNDDWYSLDFADDDDSNLDCDVTD